MRAGLVVLAATFQRCLAQVSVTEGFLPEVAAAAQQSPKAARKVVLAALAAAETVQTLALLPTDFQQWQTQEAAAVAAQVAAVLAAQVVEVALVVPASF